MAVRSTRLWRIPAYVFPASPPYPVFYTVPAGRTAVVRRAFIKNEEAIAIEVSLILMGNPAWVGTIPARSVGELGYMVLLPGDELSMSGPATRTVRSSGFGSLLLGAPE